MIRFSVVVRDPNSWSGSTGVHTKLRECGHSHLSCGAAEACQKRLLHAICNHGRQAGTPCKHCLGYAQAHSWSGDWFNSQIETNTGKIVDPYTGEVRHES